MAMFGGKDDPERGEAKSGANGAEGGLSIIGHGMTVTGDIDGHGVVKIEGRIEGSIRGVRQVLVGRKGEVKGDIETREAIIGGRVEGSIVATERVEVQGTSLVDGDINTKTIVVMEGGRINGNVTMNESPVTSRPIEEAPRPQVAGVR
ncbi:MAG TPA: polymer-forming cytoskeletal protein [Gemmatimonadaceae bacterium]|nr:polymer-forming cytoskeletal protein [Gemmatimonadaceae bacterium]